MCIKLDNINKVLFTFSVAQIRKEGNYYCVSWNNRGNHVCKRWQCRGQDFYPVWSQKFPGGGTSMTAVSQLVRWLQNKPVLPIATWRYWASEKVKLLDNNSVDILAEAGYPSDAKCVLCGRSLHKSLDWWHLGKVSGPCCHYSDREGCRQNVSVL